MLFDSNLLGEPTASRRWRFKALVTIAILGAICLSVTLRPAQTEAEQKNVATKSKTDVKTADKTAKQTVHVAGACVDAKKQPIADAEVCLYEEAPLSCFSLCGKTRTNADGRFAFEDLHLNTPAFDEDVRHFFIVAKAKGKARAYDGFHTEKIRKDAGRLELKMSDAATIEGRVADPSGKPISVAVLSSIPGMERGQNYFYWR